jgi:hypothetical protein
MMAEIERQNSNLVHISEIDRREPDDDLPETSQPA